MNLEDIEEQIEKLREFLENQKKLFIKLIKIKTDSDMEKVINAIGSLKQEINTFDHKLETSIGASNSKIDNIKWFIGGAIGLAAALAKLFKIF